MPINPATQAKAVLSPAKPRIHAATRMATLPALTFPKRKMPKAAE